MEEADQNYPRSQRSTMSIQDRIRAMNHHTSLDDDEDEGGMVLGGGGDQRETQSAVPPKLSHSPTPRKHKDSLTSEEMVELSEEEAVPPKRASVVEMWRRREGSSARGRVSTTSTIPLKEAPDTTNAPDARKLPMTASASPVHKGLGRQAVVGVLESEEEKREPGYNFEEKKEQSFDGQDETEWRTSQNEEKPENLAFFHQHQVVTSGPVDLTYLAHAHHHRPKHSQRPASTTNVTGPKRALFEPARSASADFEDAIEAAGQAPDQAPDPSLSVAIPKSSDSAGDSFADEEGTPRRRSSVVDIWMKRGTASAGGGGSSGGVGVGATPSTATPTHKKLPPLPSPAARAAVNNTNHHNRQDEQGWAAAEGGGGGGGGGGPTTKSFVSRSPSGGGSRSSQVVDFGGSADCLELGSNESPANRKNLRSKVRSRWMQQAQSDSGMGGEEDPNNNASRATSQGGPSVVSPSVTPTPLDTSFPSASKDEKDKGASNHHHKDEPVDQNRASPFNDVRARWGKTTNISKDKSSGPTLAPTPKWSPPAKALGPPNSPKQTNHVGDSEKEAHPSTQPSARDSPQPGNIATRWSKRTGATNLTTNTTGYLGASPRRDDRLSPAMGLRANNRTPRASVGERENQSGNTPVVVSPVLVKADQKTSTNALTRSYVPQPTPTDVVVDCSSASQDTLDAPGDIQKKKNLLKLGQKHVSSRPEKPRGPEHDEGEEDSSYGDTAPTDSFSTQQTADSTNSGTKKNPPKVSYGFQRWRKDSLKIQTQRLDPTTQGPATTQAIHRGEEDSGPIVTQAHSTGSRGNRNRFADKKQLLLARQRHRVRATIRSSESAEEEVSMDSSTLSAAFLDAVPDDEQNQLSHEIMTRHQKVRRGPAPSVLMEDLLACGPEESDLKGEESLFEEQTAVLSPGANSEYASLCVSDSDSFLFSDFSKTNPSNPWSPRNNSALLRLDSNSEVGQSFTSGAGSAFTGFAVASPSSRTGGAQNATSPLAARAGRVLQGKRQRKRDDDSPAAVPVENTPRVGHRSNPSPVATGDREKEGGAFHHLEFLDPSMSSTYATQSQTPTSMQSPTAFGGNGSMNSPSAFGGPTRRNFSFSSETTGASSQMMSTSEGESNVNPLPAKSGAGSPSKRIVKMPTKDVVAEEFVSESNSNVAAFHSAYQSLSLEQIAKDLKEEVAGSMLNGVHALNLAKLATDLNEGMSAASESLNKLVGGVGAVESQKGKLRVPTRECSPVEEGVAIEVEYIEDSDEEQLLSDESFSNHVRNDSSKR